MFKMICESGVQKEIMNLREPKSWGLVSDWTLRTCILIPTRCTSLTHFSRRGGIQAAECSSFLLVSPKILDFLIEVEMAALQDFVAAVYSAKLYIVILTLCAYGLRNYVSYRKLAHINGPLLAKWTSFWIVSKVYNMNTHQELYEVTKKYGMLPFSFDC